MSYCREGIGSLYPQVNLAGSSLGLIYAYSIRTSRDKPMIAGQPCTSAFYLLTCIYNSTRSSWTGPDDSTPIKEELYPRATSLSARSASRDALIAVIERGMSVRGSQPGREAGVVPSSRSEVGTLKERNMCLNKHLSEFSSSAQEHRQKPSHRRKLLPLPSEAGAFKYARTIQSSSPPKQFSSDRSERA